MCAPRQLSAWKGTFEQILADGGSVPLAEVTVFSRSPRCEAGQLIIEFLDQDASK
jgi:hypothetical protein